MTYIREPKRYGPNLCSVEGCERYDKGYMCRTHATRMRKHGDPGPAEIRRMVPFGTPPVQKIDLIGWTEDERGCWIWNGRRDRDGYGLVDDNRGVPVAVHRVAYGKWVGSVPDGKVLMHSCDAPACINPDHLRFGTQADNIHDMWDKGRARPWGKEQRSGRKVS